MANERTIQYALANITTINNIILYDIQKLLFERNPITHYKLDIPDDTGNISLRPIFDSGVPRVEIAFSTVQSESIAKTLIQKWVKEKQTKLLGSTLPREFRHMFDNLSDDVFCQPYKKFNSNSIYDGNNSKETGLVEYWLATYDLKLRYGVHSPKVPIHGKKVYFTFAALPATGTSKGFCHIYEMLYMPRLLSMTSINNVEEEQTTPDKFKYEDTAGKYRIFMELVPIRFPSEKDKVPLDKVTKHFSSDASGIDLKDETPLDIAFVHTPEGDAIVPYWIKDELAVPSRFSDKIKFPSMVYGKILIKSEPNVHGEYESEYTWAEGDLNQHKPRRGAIWKKGSSFQNIKDVFVRKTVQSLEEIIKNRLAEKGILASFLEKGKFKQSQITIVETKLLSSRNTAGKIEYNPNSNIYMPDSKTYVPPFILLHHELVHRYNELQAYFFTFNIKPAKYTDSEHAQILQLYEAPFAATLGFGQRPCYCTVKNNLYDAVYDALRKNSSGIAKVEQKLLDGLHIWFISESPSNAGNALLENSDVGKFAAKIKKLIDYIDLGTIIPLSANGARGEPTSNDNKVDGFIKASNRKYIWNIQVQEIKEEEW